MNRIRDAYAARGVAVYAVQADPSVPEPEVIRYAKEYRYTFPLLIDPKQTLVRHVGATVTPQAAILATDGKLLYLGRIDNRVADFGKQRLQATGFDLRESLDAILSGKPVEIRLRNRSDAPSIGLPTNEDDLATLRGGGLRGAGLLR